MASSSNNIILNRDLRDMGLREMSIFRYIPTRSSFNPFYVKSIMISFKIFILRKMNLNFQLH